MELTEGRGGEGGGGWEGASWPPAKGLFCSGLVRTCAAPGLGTSPKFSVRRAGSALREQRAGRKRFTHAGLLGQIF